MPHPAKVLLVTPVQSRSALAAFVEDCLRDGVELIAVAGSECASVEEEIDLLIVGDGSDDSRFIVTSSHEDETFEEAYNFAVGWGADGEGSLEVVRL